MAKKSNAKKTGCIAGLFKLTGLLFVYLFRGIKMLVQFIRKKSAAETAGTPATLEKLPDTKTTKPIEIKDGEKDYDYMPLFEGQNVLRYQYENNLYIPEDVDVNLLRGNGGHFVTFQAEPDNPFDNKAIAVILNKNKIGYVYRGQTQDMIHDWIRRGEPMNAFLNKFSVEDRKATYKIGFYKPLSNYEEKIFSLIKISKKAVDEYSNSRLEGLNETEIGEVLTVQWDSDTEGYCLVNESFDEIGALPKKAVAYIDESNAEKAVGILVDKDVELDDYTYELISGEAKVAIYLIK